MGALQEMINIFVFEICLKLYIYNYTGLLNWLLFHQSINQAKF